MTDVCASDTALIVVDVPNPYRHEDAEQLAAGMADTVPAIMQL